MQYAKLWKRILNEGIDTSPNDPEAFSDLKNRIIAAPIIVAAVTKPAGKPTGEKIDWNDYAPVSVPFDEFWIEGSDTCDFDGIEKPVEWGSLVFAVHQEEECSLVCLGIAGTPSQCPVFFGCFSAELDGNYHLLPSHGLYVSRRFSLADIAKIEISLTTLFAQVMDNLLLLGCKNVALEPHENDPQQVRRAVKRHGGTPGKYRYHTLVVRPPGARSDAPAQDIGIMPRHVCRGHFAEYGPEFDKGLLFGRLSGRFYIPPHLKGDKKNGVVEKDYLIAPPAPEIA